MRKQLLFFLVFVLSAITMAAANVSESEAVGAVKASLGQDATKYDYYIVDDHNTEYWTVFVDADPTKLWGHQCYTYQIPKNISTGSKITPVNKNSMYNPPEQDILPIDVKNKIIGKVNKSLKLPYKTGARSINKDASRIYALILGGCTKNSLCEPAFWNDCSFFYQTLTRTYGVPKENIYPLISDGNDTENLDIFVGNNGFPGEYCYDQSLDLDNDGEDEIELACTRKNIENVLTHLGNTIKPNDFLFIFMIGHGTVPNGGAIWINKGDENSNRPLYSYELAGWLKKSFTGKNVNIGLVMGQCYAGSFIKDIRATGLDKIIISTAVDSATPSSYHEVDEFACTRFLYNWTSAINGANIKMESVNADSNNDGQVSLLEAVNYATSVKHKIDGMPQYESIPQTLGSRISFNYIPTDFNLGFNQNDGDINTTSWDSEALYATSENSVEHSNIYSASGDKLFNINVNIENNGVDDYDGRYKWCHLYWAKESTVINDNVCFSNENYHDAKTGGFIATLPIPEIPAGKSKTLSHEWLASNSLFKTNDGEPHTLSLIAKISDSPAITDDEEITGSNDASVARKSRFTIESGDYNKKFGFFIRNTTDETKTYDVTIVPRTSEDSELLKHARILMGLYPMLNYSQGDSAVLNSPFSINTVNALGGITVDSVSDNIGVIATNITEIKGVELPKKSIRKLFVRIGFPNLTLMDGKTYLLDIVQKDENGSIVGGFTLEVKKPKQSLIPLTVNVTQVAPGIAELAADDEYSSYSWYDESNNLIGEKSSVIVKPDYDNQVYLVNAINNDGEQVSGEVAVRKFIGIENLSYPSDCADEIILSFYEETNETSLITINSADNGTLIYKENLEPKSLTANISTAVLKSGLYILSYYVNGEKLNSIIITKK